MVCSSNFPKALKYIIFAFDVIRDASSESDEIQYSHKCCIRMLRLSVKVVRINNMFFCVLYIGVNVKMRANLHKSPAPVNVVTIIGAQ